MTWSIVAHDPATDAVAVAVATRAFAVGASCPFVRSGVGDQPPGDSDGAIASMNHTAAALSR